MSRHKGHIQSVIAGFVLAGVCLLSSSTAAQQPKEGTLSGDDLINLHQQIKELKNPTFRAFLRMQLLSWESPEAGPTRRRAAMEVAAQGVADLCEHQDEVWSPTASWLYESLVKQIKTLTSPEDTALEICVLKTATANKSTKDLSSGIKVFREAIKTINELPSPDKDQEKMYYVHLMPIAEDLIRSFRLLATRESQAATSLAIVIKLSELRVAALSGVYSTKRSDSAP